MTIHAQASPSSDRVFYDDLWKATTRVDQHHKCRIYAIERVLRAVLPGRRLKILEPGCGNGMVSHILARYGDVTGIDQSAVGVELARSSTQGRFLLGCLPNIDVDDEEYDVCVLSQVIEHLSSKDQLQVLRNIHARVRPGGLLVITTPHRPVSSRMRFDAGELQPLENWLEPDRIRDMLEGTGWKATQLFWCFNFFPVTFSRWKSLRGLRYLVYDVLQLRRRIEAMTASWRVGDTTVAVAVKQS